jgi:hypothetical protein
MAAAAIPRALILTRVRRHAAGPNPGQTPAPPRTRHRTRLPCPPNPQKRLVPASDAVTITRSVPHGHVAAVHAMARELGLSALLGPAGRPRDLALALVISRVVAPGSKWMSACSLTA